MAAASAFNAYEAMLETTTTQVVLELVHNKGWQRRIVVRKLVPQGRQVLFDDRVEHGLFRLMTPVPMNCWRGWS